MPAKQLPIKLKTGETKTINPDDIDYVKPYLHECEIHMVDGKVYRVWEDFKDLRKRIKNARE